MILKIFLKLNNSKEHLINKQINNNLKENKNPKNLE